MVEREKKIRNEFLLQGTDIEGHIYVAQTRTDN